MTLQLYFAPGACSLVPHFMLEKSGLAWEPKPIRLHKGEQHSHDYKVLNPRSQVPVLVLQGKPITQLVAIVDTLDQLSPASGFIPKDTLARAKWLETLTWMNNTVHPAFTHAFMPAKFTDDAAAQAAVKAHALRQYRTLLTELQAALPAVQAQTQTQTHGEPNPSGADASPLDAYALTLLRWGTIVGIDPEDYPALWAHVQRVAQDPAMARAMEREKLGLSLYKPPAA